MEPVLQKNENCGLWLIWKMVIRMRLLAMPLRVIGDPNKSHFIKKSVCVSHKKDSPRTGATGGEVREMSYQLTETTKTRILEGEHV